MATRSGPPLSFLGIAGSLRRASYNRGLIRAAIKVAPAGTSVVPYDCVRPANVSIGVPTTGHHVPVAGGLLGEPERAASDSGG